MSDGREVVAGGRPDGLDPSFYERVLDGLAEAVFVFDLDGTAVWWNRRLCEVTGYTDAEIAGMHPAEFVPEEDAAAVPGMMAAAVAGEDAVSLESELVTKDGERIPTEFVGSQVTDDDGEVLALVGTGRDVSERARARAELREERDRFGALFESISEAVVRVTFEDRRAVVRRVNPAFEETFGYDAEAVVGRRLDDVIVPDSLAEEGRRLDHRAVAGESVDREVRRRTADGLRDFLLRTVPFRPADGEMEALGIYVDVTGRKERERELLRQRDELATLNEINALVQAVLARLVRAATREEIETVVCEGLADSGLYRSAWIGERSPGAPEIVPRTTAGIEASFFEAMPIRDDAENDGPGARAIRTGEVQIVDDVAADPTMERWSHRAVDAGIRSLAAIPLGYGNTVYGLLGVHAPTTAAFSDRELAALAVLGDVVGFAINAAGNRRLLAAAASVELEFVVDGPGGVLRTLSTEFGCECEIEGVVPVGDGSLLHYATVTAADPEAVLDAIAAYDGVADARLVSDGDDECVVEYTCGCASPVQAITDHGGIVLSARAVDGVGYVTAQVPSDADARDVVEHVTHRFPGTELRRKHPVDRPPATAQGFRREFDDRLTDRQRAALRAAHLAGYFEWPRDSTAEAVADSLDVSTPTLLYHLRTAERELLAAFFENRE